MIPLLDWEYEDASSKAAQGEYLECGWWETNHAKSWNVDVLPRPLLGTVVD